MPLTDVLYKVKNGRGTVYWDGKELKEGAFPLDKIQRGFIGIYANFVGGLGEATAKVDSIMLREVK